MSGSFEGFSEDDIRKINNTGSSTKLNNSYSHFGPRRCIRAVRRQNKNIDLNIDSLYKTGCSNMEPIEEKAKLCKSNSTTLNEVQEYCDRTSTTETESKNDIKNIEIKTFEIDNLDNGNSLSKSEKDQVNGNSLSLSERKIDLDEFQIRQKLMEEQNRKRKELLAKLLAAKTKQTKEEAQRLNEIEDELRKLDALLSNDVNILRKQIEVASLDYMEAQKQYFKIEKEFLDTKLVLHQKLERKEMLTEHLCTIIENNEERKAQKLTELLVKLNVNTDAEPSPKLNDVDKIVEHQTEESEES